jgi:hypothetical protein
VRSSAVLGSARKPKGEYALPFATRDNEREDARLFVETMPQLPCRVTGFYVAGETFQVEPEIVLPGQWARLEIPEHVARRIMATTTEITCGVLAQVEGERAGMMRLQWKLPMGAHVAREQVPTALAVPPNSTVIVQWQPEVASRFKRFAAEIIGDKDALFINDFRLGKDSFFLSSTPVPMAVAMVPGAFEVPDMIVPGIIMTVSLSNRSAEAVEIGGGIVLVNVEEEFAVLQKKYEEETRARIEAIEKAAEGTK